MCKTTTGWRNVSWIERCTKVRSKCVYTQYMRYIQVQVFLAMDFFFYSCRFFPPNNDCAEPWQLTMACNSSTYNELHKHRIIPKTWLSFNHIFRSVPVRQCGRLSRMIRNKIELQNSILNKCKIYSKNFLSSFSFWRVEIGSSNVPVVIEETPHEHCARLQRQRKSHSANSLVQKWHRIAAARRSRWIRGA